MLQRANWKVVGILLAMTAASILIPNWPTWAQQNSYRTGDYDQPGAKREQPQDTKSDLKRTADELAKLKQYLDMLKADYDSRAAQLQDAQKAGQHKPATIEQRLSEIEHKLDLIIAALGKRGPMATEPSLAPLGTITTPVPPGVQPVPAPRRQPPVPPEASTVAPVFPAPEPAKR
jgi:hypothetical protein